MPEYDMKCRGCNARRKVTMTAAEFVSSDVACRKCGGAMVRQMPGAGAPGAPGGHSSKCWPQTDLSFGVHPSQVKEAAETDRKLGVCADYAHNGDKVFPSREAKRKWYNAHRRAKTF